VNRNREENDINTLHRSGAPRVTTRPQDEAIVGCVRRNGFTTSIEIRRELELQCSTDTIRRRLHEADLKCFIPMRKPALLGNSRVRRLEYAQQHLDWDEEEWNRTVFTDEKTFTCSHTGRVTLWRVPGSRNAEENIAYNRLQKRCTVSVWGSMTAQGPGDLVFIDERQRAEDHHQILSNIMWPHAQEQFPHGIVNYVQDNAPVHTAQIIRDWQRRQQRLHVLNHPPYSPDLNPIENLWGIMAQRWRQANVEVRDILSLQAHVRESWELIRADENLCRNLALSMNRRLEAVIANNGGATRY